MVFDHIRRKKECIRQQNYKDAWKYMKSNIKKLVKKNNINLNHILIYQSDVISYLKRLNIPLKSKHFIVLKSFVGRFRNSTPESSINQFLCFLSKY